MNEWMCSNQTLFTKMCGWLDLLTLALNNFIMWVTRVLLPASKVEKPELSQLNANHGQPLEIQMGTRHGAPSRGSMAQ